MVCHGQEILKGDENGDEDSDKYLKPHEVCDLAAATVRAGGNNDDDKLVIAAVVGLSCAEVLASKDSSETDAGSKHAYDIWESVIRHNSEENLKVTFHWTIHDLFKRGAMGEEELMNAIREGCLLYKVLMGYKRSAEEGSARGAILFPPPANYKLGGGRRGKGDDTNCVDVAIGLVEKDMIASAFGEEEGLGDEMNTE